MKACGPLPGPVTGTGGEAEARCQYHAGGDYDKYALWLFHNANPYAIFGIKSPVASWREPLSPSEVGAAGSG